MVYDALDPADIEAGKPTKEEIFDTIRENQESFDTDIEALKQTSIMQIFNLVFAGSLNQYEQAALNARIPVFRAPAAATIVSFKMALLTVSTSGTLEIELEKSTDEGVNWTPLLNNPVEITGTAIGSISGTVDWVSVALQSFAQGDLLRAKVTGLQVDQGSFQLSIYSELS